MLSHSQPAQSGDYGSGPDGQVLLQLVQSRTFGAAGKRRELVRMLVPLVDFFNHRGDESAGALGQSVFAGENARCDLACSGPLV